MRNAPAASAVFLAGVAPVFMGAKQAKQATGLDAWASRVKCPAQFVSHLHEICIYIYIYELFIAFVSFVVCSLL